MPQIFSIANFKGGVGKTTTAVNLSAGLAREGYRVLCIDMDAQANTTFSFGLLGDLEQSVYHLIDQTANGKKPNPDDFIFRMSDNLFVLPASLELATADMRFGGFGGREKLLLRSLRPILDKFEVVLIDCPPSMGLLTQNALAFSDYVIIPTTIRVFAS